jgi:penicillin amidase
VRSRWPRRLAVGLGLGAGLLVITLAAAFLWYRQASLPLHEGALRISGVQQPVEVRRDEAGVPHIRGATEDDVLFALGFAHAQDRLWQMDFNRRLAQGRLSELSGPAGVDIDRFLRTIGVMQLAQRLVDDMDQETRSQLQSYVAGVNAAMRTRTGPLPPEFLLTRTPAPAPWTEQDSMAWGVMMALDLGQSWRDELARLLLAARFSKAEIDELRPDPSGMPFVAADYVELYRLMGLFAQKSALLEGATRLADLPSLGGFGIGSGIGSNNWVVAGGRSKSGQPLLANDPHLGLATPAVVYMASLHVTGAQGFKVFGGTMPGLPYVLFGRTAQVAWGFTNVEADGEDLYIERVRPDDPTQYQTPDGWAAFVTREEVIRVKGADDVRLTVRSTRHGPVLSGALTQFGPAPVEAKDSGAARAPRPQLASQYVLALRWAAAEPGDTTMRAFRALNRAGSVADIEAALRDFTLIRQNVVFAQAAVPGRPSRIGWIAAGRMPLRKPESALRGQVPAPGWDAANDWAGFLRYEQLPRVIDPPEGFIATANARVVDRPFPLHIASSTFALPYRMNRIRQLLAAEPQHDVASMQRIQMDQRDLAARALLPLLSRTQVETTAAKVALARLQQWDGSMLADAPEPLLYHAWLRELRRRIFEDDLGAPLAPRNEMLAATQGVLEGRFKARDWCNDQSTQRRESCEELLSESLETVVKELASSTGKDVLGLRWGEQHPAVLEHRPMSNVPLVRGWFERRVAVGGATNTVNVAAPGSKPGAPFAAEHGPVLRVVYDLAGEGGVWTVSSGQNGSPLDDVDVDLVREWAQGKYRPIEYEPKARRLLVLQPAVR